MRPSCWRLARQPGCVQCHDRHPFCPRDIPDLPTCLVSMPRAWDIYPPFNLLRCPPIFPTLRWRWCRGELLPAWGFATSKPPVQAFAWGRGWKLDPRAVPAAGSQLRLPGRTRDAGAPTVPTPALCLHRGE